MTITKETLISFRNDFSEAVKELENKYNIKLKIGNIEYTESSFKTKLEAVSINSSQDLGKPLEVIKCEEDWKNFHNLFGLDSELLGKEINIYGETYKILGLNHNRRKYNVLAERKGKLVYICSRDLINLKF